jgi:hypothetical protein
MLQNEAAQASIRRWRQVEHGLLGGYVVCVKRVRQGHRMLSEAGGKLPRTLPSLHARVR